MGDPADDGADEVKVFRKNDADEMATDSIQANAQLHEDKQDVAFEAEMETQPPINGHKPPIAFPFCSLPISPITWMSSPYQSPSYPGFNLAAAMTAAVVSPHYQSMINLMRMQHISNQFNHSPMEQKPTTSQASHNSCGGPMTTPRRKKENRESKLKDKDHIKKPLNAFMWFMKENRQKVLSEDENKAKQSAELNTILGKMWHDLSKEEQQKYYEKAKEERENHARLYPNWSARENYAVHKKKRKKREKSVENMESKKCRARFGVNNTDQWCKHCKRKKRCLMVRDSESPHNGGSSSTNPATPHMLGSPLSGFSRASTASTSEEDDCKDSKNHLIKPTPLPHNQSNLMPSMLGFPGMSPSFPMFNFNMANFTSPSFPMMPSSTFNSTVTGGPPGAPTLQTLN